jgi:hypothetical protein
VTLIIPPTVVRQLAGLPRADAGRLLERLKRIAAAPNAAHPNGVPLSGQPGVLPAAPGPVEGGFLD